MYKYSGMMYWCHTIFITKVEYVTSSILRHYITSSIDLSVNRAIHEHIKLNYEIVTLSSLLELLFLHCTGVQERRKDEGGGAK